MIVLRMHGKTSSIDTVLYLVLYLGLGGDRQHEQRRSNDKKWAAAPHHLRRRRRRCQPHTALDSIAGQHGGNQHQRR